MDLDRLYSILRETTVQLRKGDAVMRKRKGSVDVVTIDAMPHETEASADLERVDLELLTVGVDKPKAENRKHELIDILKTYPHPERLSGGPSYIEVGAEIGGQGAAFQLFALGKVLGLWSVITPQTLGFSGARAREVAGRGFVMISGYTP